MASRTDIRTTSTDLVAREQALVLFADVNQEPARFEQRQVAVLVNRELPERLVGQVCVGLVLKDAADQPFAIRLADLLQRPAHPQILDSALRERRLAFHIGESPPVVTRYVVKR